MIIGVPREIKNNEFRVGMIPANVRELVDRGHSVLVETQAGMGVGIRDSDYQTAGAQICMTAAEIFEYAELIVKVKEPQAPERALLNEGHTLFTFLHLAPDYEQTKDLIKSRATCIAYETVTDPAGGLPILAPMSEVAGRLSIQAGANFLQKINGGSGILPGGVAGVEPAKVVIIGGGTVGRNAAQMAVGLGAEVVLLDRNPKVLREIEAHFGNRIKTVFSTSESLERHVLQADLLIGAVLIPGASAPKLVSAEQVRKMKAGSVIVDVAIDQGGCVETAHPTTHEKPTFIVDEVVHYCVANIPGAVPRTSAFALNHATLPYLLNLADKGVEKALLEDEGFLQGLNVCKGEVTCREVAEGFELNYTDPKVALLSQ